MPQYTSFTAFLKAQTKIHEQKESDYNSRFMRGLIDPALGPIIWRWEVIKKLDRIRTWINTGTLSVKGEGVDNAVGDLYNYTVQYLLYLEAKVSRTLPEIPVTAVTFHACAWNMLLPSVLIDLLIDEGLMTTDEDELRETIINHMEA